MPNIIVSLKQEMMRVHALIPRLDMATRIEALNALHLAEAYFSTNSYEGMTESLSDLREFTLKPKKAEASK